MLNYNRSQLNLLPNLDFLSMFEWFMKYIFHFDHEYGFLGNNVLLLQG